MTVRRTSIQWIDSEQRLSDDGGDDVSTAYRSLTFDSITSQTRDMVADLPEHPVEDGSAATDHVTPKPKTVSFEAHISSAIFDSALDSGVERGRVEAAGSQAMVFRADTPVDRVADAMSILDDLRSRGTEVDIIGLPYGDLEGYQIFAVSISQDQMTGAQLVPTISARQRVTVSVSEVDAPAPSVERTRRSRDRGTQVTAEVSATAPGTNQSDALALARGIGNILSGTGQGAGLGG